MRDRPEIIIADDEQLICGMIRGMIRCDEVGITIVDEAHDGETLLDMIERRQPDIVIIDVCMPKMDGLEVIRRVKQKGMATRFIVISGFRQFDYVYNALKYEVDDYLLKPIDAKELNDVLTKLCLNLRRKADDPLRNRDEKRTFFWDRVMPELKPGAVALEKINQTYDTRFREGLFRMLFFKFDYLSDLQMIYERFSVLQRKVEEIATAHLRDISYDMLFQKKYDGVIMLINYAPSQDPLLLRKAGELLQYTRDVTEMFSGLYLTISVADAFEDIGLAKQAQNEALATSWSRMVFGIGKVIIREDTPESLIAPYRGRLEEMRTQMLQACRALDEPAFERAVNQLFTLPDRILALPETREVLHAIKGDFFETNKELISNYTDVTALRSEVESSLIMCCTLAKYQQVYKASICQIMRQLQENIRRQNVKTIRQAVVFIEKNYGSKIYLEDIAREVYLSPVYFSNIFKKEMGQTFTEYVSDFRMKMAKKLLKSSAMNINEVAQAVGMPNARYFSKIFKKNVGITPTEYQKIYG